METGKKGLTFIELLIVIALIAIITAVSAPNIRKTLRGIELKNAAGGLQSFMNYLCQRAVSEEEVISLVIDNNKHEYYSRAKDSMERIKTYHFPESVKITTQQPEIFFYPDGSIDKVNIQIAATDIEPVILTTEGVYSGVKVQAQK